MMLALALLVSGLPFVFGTVYYMVADDYLLNYIANGSYGWTYSDHLTFIKMPFGVLLKALYGITTSVNWYFLLFLGLLVLSFAILHLTVWRRTRSFFFLGLSAFLNYMVVAHFLSFTVVSFACAAAGLFGLCCAMKEGKDVKKWGFVCAAFLLFSYFLRKQAALESVLIFLPLLFVSFRRQGTLVLRQILAPVICFAALFLLCFAFEKAAYSSPEWQEFRIYDDARSSVVDNHIAAYDETKEELNEIGIGRLDLSMLSSWRYCEKGFFTKELLEDVAEINASHTSFEDRISYTKQNLGIRLVPFLIAPIIFLVGLILAGKLNDKLFAVLSLLIVYGLLFWVAFFRMRFVMRVVMPTQLFGAYAIAGFADPREMRVRTYIVEAVTTALIVACSLQYVQYFIDINPVSRTYYESMPKKQLADEIASHPDTLYVFDAAALSHLYYFGTPASKVLTTDHFKNVTRTGSWDSYSPRYYEQISPFIENPDNLLTSIVSEDNVAYVTTGNAGEIEEFYKEQTGKKVKKKERKGFEGMDTAIWYLQ